MIGPSQAALLCQRLLERLARRRVLAALGVDEAEHLLQLRLSPTGVLRNCASARPSAPARNSRIGIRSPSGRIAGLVVSNKSTRTRTTCSALSRSSPATRLCSASARACSVATIAEGRNTGDEHRSRRDREAVPAHELARPVAKGVGLGEHGAAAEEAFDLLSPAGLPTRSGARVPRAARSGQSGRGRRESVGPACGDR